MTTNTDHKDREETFRRPRPKTRYEIENNLDGTMNIVQIITMASTDNRELANNLVQALYTAEKANGNNQA